MTANACASNPHACMSPAHPARALASAPLRLDQANATLGLVKPSHPTARRRAGFFIPGSLWIEGSYPRETANAPQSLDLRGFPARSKNYPREIANQGT